MRKSLLGAALVAGAIGAVGGLAAAPSAARADTISIGLAINGGPITNEGSGTGTFAFSGSFDGFNVNNISGAGTPPLTDPKLLASQALDVSTAGTPNVLDVYITESGITAKVGIHDFISGLTTNLISAGWTATLSTYLDAGDGVFTTTTPLATDTFSAISATDFTDIANAGSGPYSLTALYRLTPNGNTGSINSTIDIESLPEPGTLLLFGSALTGLGLIRRRRRRDGGKQPV